MLSLPLDELRRRAAGVRLVVTDCDGVLTDGTVYYSAKGEELKRFSLRDGMGMELLGKAGIRSAILTREKSEIVAARGRKLGLEHVFLGVMDKRAFLGELSERTGVEPGAIAYIGDDVNDAEVMRAIGDAGGLAGAPADALPPAREVAHKITNAPGGRGAFREFADFILALRPARDAREGGHIPAERGSS